MEVDWKKYQNDLDALKKLWKAAHVDALTKLYNRYGMETWITQELEKKPKDIPAALLIIDVDNFKYVNDTFGHMIGDVLLIDIADTIREIFSEQYFCGRVGGDEYLIFSNDAEKDDIRTKAENLCKTIKLKYEEEHQDYGVSVSVGIAFSTEQRGNVYADLYKMADLALYQAKAEGKNCYVVFGESDRKVNKSDMKARKRGHVEQVGDSGFSTTKIMLDAAIDVINDNYDPRAAIEGVAKIIVDTFDVTRAYASCYTKDGMHIGKSYFYAQNDDKNIPPMLKMSAQEYREKYFNSDYIFFCTDIENTPEPIRSELKRMEVKTLLQVLIHKDGKVIGTLGINNCGYKRLWLQSEIETMHTIAKLLTGHIYRLQQESED